MRLYPYIYVTFHFSTLAARHTPHRVTLPSSLRSLVRPPVSPLLPSLYYGYQLQGHTLLLGCARLSSPDPLADPPADWSLPAAAVLSTLPLGVCIVGLHLGTPPPDMPLPLEKLLGSLGSLPTLVFPNNRLVLSHLTAAANDVTYQLLDCSSGTLSPVSVSHEPISLISSLVDDCVIKLELKQEVKCDISHESFPDSFSTELSTLRSFIQSQPSLFSVGTGSLSKSKCKSISIPFPPSAPSKAKRPPPIKETLSLKKHVYPLSLSLPPPTSSRYILPLHYHIWASADLPHTQLDSVLRDGLVRYLDALCDVTRTPSLPPCYISICHIPHPLLPFLPLPLPNPHTDLPNNSLISPLSLSPLRQTLSALLLLPPTTPYLFSHRVYPLTPLHLPVPHLSLPASPAPCCSLLQTVSGLYDYYHYLSDGVDDCGWGCAYRSLQTIFSWYVLQGYVRGRDTPPSHLEAQEILVAVGDKPASFPHSREWIGSVEVGLVLQDMLSVQHKILHLSSREELPDVARQLLHHFERWGTPVMMGGGQLAHTLLGVAYDESMGTCQLLVLDPHYRGPDDIRAVLKGGWCAWRGVSFWKPNTFYNLCLPLRDFID